MTPVVAAILGASAVVVAMTWGSFSLANNIPKLVSRAGYTFVPWSEVYEGEPRSNPRRLHCPKCRFWTNLIEKTCGCALHEREHFHTRCSHCHAKLIIKTSDDDRSTT